VIIAFYASLTRRAGIRVRRAWRWACLHPRWATVIVLASWWALMVMAGTTAAYADSNDITVPFLPPTTIADSSGVSLQHYAVLPLDRGDMWTWTKSWNAQIVDSIWNGNIIAIGWMLWLFEWLLGFQWVGWISAPLNDIATLVQNTLSQIGWIPFALSLAAGIGGFVMLKGRYATGFGEIAVSIMCSILAVGILANPVAALTGEHGALPWAEKWGANLSVSIVSDDSTGPSGTPSVDDGAKVLSSTITSQMMDIFVRDPAQIIAFGHPLTGQCDKTFTEEMKKASPIDTSSTSVRDAVGSCDADAKEFATHPGVGQIFTAATVALGSLVLFLLGLAMAVVLMMCVFYALTQALKLMGAVYAGVAPGVARVALWRSLIGMYTGAISVGISVVMLSAYLKILTDLMASATDGKTMTGLNIVGRTFLIDLVVIVLIVSLFVARHKAKKAGQSLADRLARIGFGSTPRQNQHPILKAGARAAGRYAVNRLSNRPTPAAASAPSKKELPASDGSGTRHAGEYTATPLRANRAALPAGTGGAATGAGPNAGGGPGLGGKLLAGAGNAAQLALAAASGGTSAVVMKAGTMAGQKVLQRHLQQPRGARALPAAEQPRTGRQTRPYEAPAAAEGSSSTSTPFGRQIVVDRDGTGRIAPAAPPRRGAYNVTTLPRRQRPVGSPVRAALERAAAKGGKA
jgi:hypothetical protein